MKIRKDFVSNSSSCSFYVHLDTQQAVDVFKTLVPGLKSLDVLYTGYYVSLKELAQWVNTYQYGNPYIETTNWLDDLKPDYVIQIGTKDDDLRSLLRYDDALDIIQNNPNKYKFPLYQNELAHSTAGKKLTKDLCEQDY